MIILREHVTVEKYIESFAAGCPESLKPTVCPSCGYEGKLHRHGRYLRKLFMVGGEFEIPIYRFKCPCCKKAVGLLPSFVCEGSQIGLSIHEEVLRKRSEGESLVKIENTLIVAGGPYSERTLWRWTRMWDIKLRIAAAGLWKYILTSMPHLTLLVGKLLPRDEWGHLFSAFKQLREKAGLLEHLSVAAAGGV